MTLQELRTRCDDVEAMGGRMLHLTMPEPKSGVRGDRIRTPFGMGNIHCVNNEGLVVFSIEIKKVRKAIARLAKELE